MNLAPLIGMNLMTNTPYTKYPVTLLFTLGRDWHAEYYVNRVREGMRVPFLRQDVERAVRAALSYDY